MNQKIKQFVNKFPLSSWSWYYWLFFYGFIPLIILIIPQLPPQIIKDYFLLNICAPALLPMFLMNYTHTELLHLTGVLSVYLVMITFVFFFEINKERIRKVSAFFFVALPLYLSIITVIYLGGIYCPVYPQMGKGFSGIASAFLGYFLYMGAIERMEEIPELLEGKGWRRGYVLIGDAIMKFLLILLLLFAAYSIGLFFDQGGSSLGNGAAHFTGLIAGILTPLVFKMYQKKKMSKFDIDVIFYVIITIFLYVLYLVRIYPV